MLKLLPFLGILLHVTFSTSPPYTGSAAPEASSTPAPSSDSATDIYSTEEGCLDFQFRCPEGRCISNAWRCDGAIDCKETAADESDCGDRYFFLVDDEGMVIDEPDQEGLLVLSDSYRGRNGTICDDGFNSKAANLICQEMGYLAAAYWNNYGYENGNKSEAQEMYSDIMRNVECSGTASFWEACSYTFTGSNDCSYYEDVVLSCTNEEPTRGFSLIGRDGNSFNQSNGLLMYNGGTVCDDGFNSKAADLICQELGFSSSHSWSNGIMMGEQEVFRIAMDDTYCSEEDESFWDCDYNDQNNDCNHSEDVLLNCRSEGTPSESFYMVDRFGNRLNESGTEGLLMFKDGTVCDDSFNDQAANLICREMGFQYAVSWTSGRYNEMYAALQQGFPTSLDDVECSLDAESFWQCSYNEYEENCSHDEDVFITCSDGRRQDLEFYLVGMNGEEIMESEQEGLLMFRNGTVCDDDFNSNAANLICQQMGYTNAVNWRSGLFYDFQSGFDTTLDDVNCDQFAERIEECYYNVNNENCDHSEDVFLTCSDEDTSDGDNFYLFDQYGQRTYESGEEALLMFNNGTVCDDNFNDYAAFLICQELGFNRASSWRSGSFFSSVQENYPTSLDNVDCPDYAESFWSCSYETEEENCSHDEDVFLTCEMSEEPDEDFSFMLMNEDGDSVGSDVEGLLMYSRRGETGTVCDDEFNDRAADFICQEMGFRSASGWRSGSTFFYNAVDFITSLDDVSCGSAARSFQDCSFDDMEENCSHTEDVYLTCEASGPGAEATFTLVDQDGARFNESGREGLLIFSGPNAPGTVCDDAFDENAAAIICKEMGFTSEVARWRSGSYFTDVQGGYPTSLDDVLCMGSDESFSDCLFDDQNEDCSHSEDVFLTCGPAGDLGAGEFMLVDAYGNQVTENRREGLLMFRSGTVCDDYFTDRAADLICQSMGFTSAEGWRAAGYYSEGQQTMMTTLDNVECYDTHETFYDCSYDDINENCSHDEDVLLTCTSETERNRTDVFYLLNQNGDIIESSLLAGLLMYGDGTVCDDSFNDYAADLICQEMGYLSAKSWKSGVSGYEALQNGSPTSLDDVSCSSTDESFWDCSYDDENEDCSHSEDVFLSCRGEESEDLVLKEVDFSMVDRNGRPFNRSGEEGLLMFRDGTVCDDAFNDNAADLICQAMGFKSARSWRSGYFNSTNERFGILLDDLSCNDTVTSVEQCYYSIADHNCGHSEDVILTCSDTAKGFYQLVPDSGRALAVGMAIMGEYDHPQLSGWLCDDGFNDIAAAQLCRQTMKTRYGKRAPSGPVTEGLPFVATNYTCNYEGRCQEVAYEDSEFVCNNRTERAAVFCYNATEEYEINVQSVEVSAPKIVIKMRVKYLKEGEVHNLHGDSAKEKISVEFCDRSVKLKGVFGRDGRYKVTGKTRGRPCSQNCLRIYIGGVVYHEEGCS